MTEGTLIRVECYAGGRADEVPRRLVFTNRTVEVAAIERRARTPDVESICLRGDNGVGYTIQQHLRAGCWRLVTVDRPA